MKSTRKKSSTTITGDAFSLAQWFITPTEASDGVEFSPEDIANEAYKFTEFGVRGNKVILRTPNGRMIVEARTVKGSRIVEFDYVPNGLHTRLGCWFNHHSVADLGDMLRKSPEKRVSFDSIFLNGVES